MDQQQIHVDRLLLDRNNPRLPEKEDVWTQGEIFAYFAEFGVLDEIIESMLDNGYFEPERLIVLRPDEDGNHVVVEGNRRLASLLAIHQRDVADEYRLPKEPTPAQTSRLEEIPCLVVDTRAVVAEYLGFRHIGGLKEWSPEAKARYLIPEVDRVKEEEEHDRPFYEVGRRVGSNAQGIRNAYIAMKVLMHARDEGVDTAYVVRDRFGVWVRCMNSKAIREYIGLGSPRTYEEVLAAVDGVDIDRLREVVADLSKQPGQVKPLLADSRDVTDYGSILLNEKAREVLRRTGKLGIAEKVISQEELPARIRDLTTGIETLQGELADRLDEEVGAEVRTAAITEAKRLLNAARVFASAVEALSEQGDDE